MNLKTDGAYYLGYYSMSHAPERIYFSFIDCASDSSYRFIEVYNNKGEYVDTLELIGGDYE